MWYNQVWYPQMLFSYFYGQALLSLQNTGKIYHWYPQKLSLKELPIDE